MPERYRERVEFKGSLANIDVNQLPHDILARIAAGENAYAVLASVVERGQLPAASEEDGETEDDV